MTAPEWTDRVISGRAQARMKLGDVTQEQRDNLWRIWENHHQKDGYSPGEPLCMYRVEGTDQYCGNCLDNLQDSLERRLTVNDVTLVRVEISPAGYEQCDVCCVQYESDDALEKMTRFTAMVIVNGHLPTETTT